MKRSKAIAAGLATCVAVGVLTAFGIGTIAGPFANPPEWMQAISETPLNGCR